MKQIITIILALFFSLSTFAQTERLSLSERNRIFNSIRNLNCSTDSVLNSFRRELFQAVLLEMTSETSRCYWAKDVFGEYILYATEYEDFDSFDFIILLTRGGIFYLEQYDGIELPNFFTIADNQWNLLEFHEYICVNQAIPFHLINFVAFRTELLQNGELSILSYVLKINSLDDIEIFNMTLALPDEYGHKFKQYNPHIHKFLSN